MKIRDASGGGRTGSGAAAANVRAESGWPGG